MTALLGPHIDIPVPEVDAILADGVYTDVRLYRSPSQYGTYAAIYTALLVAGQTSYPYDDAAGSATNWYRYTWYNHVSLAESSPSASVPGGTSQSLDLLTIRRRVTARFGLFAHPEGDYNPEDPSVTCTADGTISTFVDANYKDSRYPSNKFREWYAYCILDAVSTNNTGKERRVGGPTGLATTTGTFTTARDFPQAVKQGALIDLYGEEPRRWWDDRINEALSDINTPFQWSFGGTTDAGGQASATEYALPAFVEDEERIQGIWYRTGTEPRGRRYTRGVDFDFRKQEGGGVIIDFYSGLSQNAVYMVDGYRHPEPLRSDSDTVLLSPDQYDLVTITAAAQAALVKSQQVGLSKEGRKEWADRYVQMEAERKSLSGQVKSWNSSRSPRREQMVAIGGRRGSGWMPYWARG